MDVKRAKDAPEPGYPSRRQFAESAKLLGIAAIGVGTVVAAGCDSKDGAATTKKDERAAITWWGEKSPPWNEVTRFTGDLPIEPRSNGEVYVTGGVMAVEPVDHLGTGDAILYSGMRKIEISQDALKKANGPAKLEIDDEDPSAPQPPPEKTR